MPKSIRVLLVEDESVVSLAFSEQLKRLGCEVVGTARDGKSAVVQAGNLLPDVVLMDIGLPGMDGIEACRQIMATRSVPIIMLSAYSDDKRLDDAKHAGAAGYLVKPTTETQLRQAIEKIFPQASEGKPGASHP